MNSGTSSHAQTQASANNVLPFLIAVLGSGTSRRDAFLGL